MKEPKALNPTKTKQNSKRNIFVLLIFVTMFLMLSAWNTEEEIPKGNYSLNYPAYFGNRIQIPKNNPLSKEGVYLGRMLFYEGRLSADNKLSCGSCHMQEKAFTDGEKLSKGIHGAQTDRNSMAIVNLLWTRKFFWDGRARTLEDQVVFPLTNLHEMGQSLQKSVEKLQATTSYPKIFKTVFGDENITADRIVKALAQFERTLISDHSKYDQYLQKKVQFNASELRGLHLFNTPPNPEKGIRGANCAHCHGGAKNYLELFHNNGLDKISKDAGIAVFTGLKTDSGRFKVPTLRNIALTAPYMHDGRFRNLEEVVEHYSEHVVQSENLSAFLQHESNVRGETALKLNVQEKKDLIAFLNTFTDSVFIADSRFSNPFLPIKTLKTK